MQSNLTTAAGASKPGRGTTPDCRERSVADYTELRSGLIKALNCGRSGEHNDLLGVARTDHDLAQKGAG
jgi:hypothetical protein